MDSVGADEIGPGGVAAAALDDSGGRARLSLRGPHRQSTLSLSLSHPHGGFGLPRFLLERLPDRPTLSFWPYCSPVRGNIFNQLDRFVRVGKKIGYKLDILG